MPPIEKPNTPMRSAPCDFGKLNSGDQIIAFVEAEGDDFAFAVAVRAPVEQQHVEARLVQPRRDVHIGIQRSIRAGADDDGLYGIFSRNVPAAQRQAIT